jgi:putative ABC transport system permease protein
MIRNYFKIAWRNLWNNRLFSFINIFGLAIGIACCTLIYLYVDYELSYDRYNENADRIFRITTVGHQPKKTDHFAPTSPIMARRLKANFPEVKDYVRFNPSRRSISYKDKKFYDTRVLYADSSLLEIFTFSLLDGDPHRALTKPYSIVLTESTAKKYFGSEQAFGKMVKFSDTINLMVTGVIKDIPQNSHFNTECFISRSTMNEMNKGNPSWEEDSEKNWFNCDSYSYLLLAENVDYKKLEPKLNKIMDKEMAEIKKEIGMSLNVELQPLTDIHLKSHLEAEFKGSVNGDITYIYIFIGTAILILLIACCNFINLSTARSLNRSKEIGLRKVIGAGRSQLVFQFLGESLLFAFIASILSIVLVVISIPLFRSFVGGTFQLNTNVLWLYLSIILSVGIVAGLYPALLMSSFAPIQSLKGKISHGISDIIFRKGLVIFQFTIAIILIIGTTLILQQLNFIQSRNIGLNKDQVVSLEFRGADARKSDVLLKELMRNPKVTHGTLNSFSFKGIANITLLPEGFAENEITACNVISVDENFLKTYQIKLAAGRDFSKDFKTDETAAFIVNEAAVKEFNWKTPKEAIGKKIVWAFGKEGKVVGVVKDFNFASLHDNVKPLLIHIFPQWFNNVSLRLKTDNLTATMKELESTWKNITSESPFKYAFAEDDFNNLYHSEQNMRTVLTAFTFLSVLVACLGLFGLASFTIKQRFKEIGIRKVLGSSVGGIVSLLSKDFLKLVIISFVIAVPVAWYFMNKWLEDFAYRIDIGYGVLLLAGIAAFAVAFVTVSTQAMKAATANPVKSIRTE